MRLGAKQELFYRMNHEFDTWLLAQPGVEIRGGELLRHSEIAWANSMTCRKCSEDKDLHDVLSHEFVPLGISNSNHCKKLAFDRNIFIDGKYITDSEELRWIGEQWKMMSTDEVTCCWGGDFRNPDGGHFSFLHEGVR